MLSRNVLTNAMFPVAAALAVGAGLGWTLAAQEAKPAKNWKDRAEYDLFEAANKAAAKDRAALLDKWKQGYPQSEYADERLELYLFTYRDLADCRRAFDTSVEISRTRPNHEFSVAVVLGCALQFQQPADLDNADRIARHVLASLDAIYADSNKPQYGFVQTKDASRTLAYRVLGYVPVTRKEWAKAETELTKGLQADGTQATLSNWLAQALVNQNKEAPQKYPLGLYHYARVAAYDGPNSFPAANRKTINDFLTKAYTSYHGSNDGLDALLATAKANPFPPANWAGIKSTVELAQEKIDAEERAAREAGPMKTAWIKLLREPLTAENGEAYFDSTVKDAALPGEAVPGVSKFRGKIIALTPTNRPKEISLAVERPDAADAILKFDDPLPGTMETGSEMGFSGVAKAFTKAPFSITFEVEPTDLDGWTGKNPPGTKGKAGGPKAGGVKPPGGKAKAK